MNNKEEKTGKFRRETIFKEISLWGFYIFAAALPFTLTIPQAGLAIAFFGWLLEGIVNKNWQIKWHIIFIPLLFYLGWSFISASLTSNPYQSLLAVLDNNWLVITAIFMFWCIEDKNKIYLLIKILLISSFPVMLYAIWQTFYGIELYNNFPLTPFGSYYRAVGFHGFYLTFAAFAMIIFLFSVSFFITKNVKSKILYFSSSVISFIAVTATFARSIWLSFAGIIPILGFMKSKKTGIIIISFFIIFIIGGYFLVPEINERITSIIDLKQNETRINLWHTAWNMAADNPFFGIGEGNFRRLFEKYEVEGFYDTKVHPHNDYLNVLANTGFPGLLAWITIWIIVIRSGINSYLNAVNIKLKAAALGAVLSVAGFLIGAFFQNYYSTFLNCMEWWFLTGIILVLENDVQIKKHNINSIIS